MAEQADKCMEEIASEFIVGTCQLIPKSHDLFSSITVMAYKRDVGKTYSVFCGSGAEFHIRPLNGLIEDLDEMLWSSNELAFTDDFPVLPNDLTQFSDTVECYKIESDLTYPGFVRLRLLGEMIYAWKCKKYAFLSTTFRNDYKKFNLVGVGYHTAVGPSLRLQLDPEHVARDLVQSIWCPQWPNEAQGWPLRHRDHGWPTTNTIFEIVNRGCHVVYVQHRACREDKRQWRLSFSVAEVILLQSWTDVQQIVYHLLRFFAKKILIRKDCPKEDEVLCTYHLKTLMMWTCEQMSPDWWNSSSVIAICCELLQTLSEWLERRHCPNYFIPEANLFHTPPRFDLLYMMQEQLRQYGNIRKLCIWFLQNYIQPVTEIFEGTKSKVMDCIIRLIDLRRDKMPNTLNILFQHEFSYFVISFLASIEMKNGSCCPRYILEFTQSLGTYTMLTDRSLALLPIPEYVSCFRYLSISLFGFFARNDLKCGKLSLDSELLVEHIKGVFFTPKGLKCQYHNFPDPVIAERIQYTFLHAQDFMENLTGANSRAEFRFLSRISQEFLGEVIKHDDSQNRQFVHAALVYLAALYFAKSDYETVIDLCSVVLTYGTDQIENETLNGGCLFFIDDVVKILGSLLLCKRFSEHVPFSKKQLYLDLRFTPEVFAYYLTVASSERLLKQPELHVIPDLSTSSFPLDKYLLALTNRKFRSVIDSEVRLGSTKQRVYKRRNRLIRSHTVRSNPLILTERLVDHLTEYAFENMTSFYNALCEDFGIECSTVDCYRALHLYKCCKFNESLQLCEQILSTPDVSTELQQFVYAHVLVVPPFDSFFDSGVQILLGFNTLFCYLQKFDFRVETFVQTFFNLFVFSVETYPASSLGISFPIKCHYSLRRHFLARYLKVRCCIDCNYSCTEAMAELAAMKIVFPFEYIIRRVLLWKRTEK